MIFSWPGLLMDLVTTCALHLLEKVGKRWLACWRQITQTVRIVYSNYRLDVIFFLMYWYHGTGVNEPRGSSKDMPSTRLVSNEFYQADTMPDSPMLTLTHMQFGQLLDHDLTLSPEAITRNSKSRSKINGVI